jgi:hypothetical protein
MSEHTWFQENLAAYGAGGLTSEEQERFQRHRTACGSCAKMLADFQGFDAAMDALFTEVRPVAGWEDQVLDRMRAAPRWRGRLWSRWMRVAVSAAALLFLGATGAVCHQFMVNGTFPEEAEAYAARHASNQGWGPWEGGNAFSPDGRHLASAPDGGSVRLGGMIVDGSQVQLGDGEKAKDVMDGQARGEKHFRLWDTATGKATSDAKRRDPEARDLEESTAALQKELAFKVQAMDEASVKAKVGKVTLEYQAPPAFHDLLTEGRAKEPPPINSEGKIAGQQSPEAKPWSEPKERPPTEVGRVTITGSEVTKARASRGPRSDNGYYTPQLTVTKVDTGKTLKEGEKKEEKSEPRGDLGGQKEKGNKTDPAPEKKPAEAGVPEPVSRKIIRTGEIEFEVDAFDPAVAAVKRLVGAVKGAFVTTVNSDKLPNGKVRGSIVVRLPPESLDKFFSDLRQELAKTGELKSQRIGSQDVTKQYIDVESRLRSARAMEERFLQIIKTGKGEIKDLIAAENALGMWRTKIEEMEGEIRYYNNQVGLSTLTITLSEKEIQAPASLVVTEKVTMQLEVDDVKKAQQAALDVAAEAKGRVTKSERKQLPAGQLAAVVHFEVAPAAAEKVRERLEKLGVVTHQDADRSQQSEGSGSRTPDVKIKQNDVVFEINMYNVANVQPREVLTIQLATPDVHAGFRKLQEAVAQFKGQVRTGQLLEQQDKLKVTAQFDFDVPSAEKKGIDQALVDAGTVVTRTSTQAAPGEAATDRKVGYRLALVNVAALPPRETLTLGVEVKDVDQASAAIVELVKSKQGRVGSGFTQQERNGRVAANLQFDVPLSAKDEVLRQVKAAGTVLLQTVRRDPQAPDGELATARFAVTLASSGPIVPSDEGLWPQIRTSLFYSFKLLSWSVMFIIMGFLVVLPWALLLWGAFKLVGKWRRRPA